MRTIQLEISVMMEIDKNKNLVKKSWMKIEWDKDKDNNATNMDLPAYIHILYI